MCSRPIQFAGVDSSTGSDHFNEQFDHDFLRSSKASTSALLPDTELVEEGPDQVAEAPDYSNHPDYFDASNLQCTGYDQVLRNKNSIMPLFVEQGNGEYRNVASLQLFT